MTHAIRIEQHGGPDVMKWETVEVGTPGPQQVRIRNMAAGLNYLDTYHRSGLYKLPLPLTLGSEGAGVVEAIGSEVSNLNVGDRVAYAATGCGSYAEALLIDANQLVKLPDSISDQQAASMMLKGMTAQYLIRRTFKVSAGDTILIHAAAGGVGSILTQWAKHLGAIVIGTVGSEAKAEQVRALGCDHVINYTNDDFVARVADITQGKKCAVVYDGVGKDTFMKSLDCVRPLGMAVLFGNASGAVPPFDLGMLSVKGSLFVTRPTMGTYTATHEMLLATANDLFDIVARGAVKIEINQTYALRDAAQAHRDLEARRTSGSTVLTV